MLSEQEARDLSSYFERFRAGGPFSINEARDFSSIAEKFSTSVEEEPTSSSTGRAIAFIVSSVASSVQELIQERQRAKHSTSDHDVSVLPKWAQRLLEEKDKEIESLEREKDAAWGAHSVIAGREWFQLENPIGDDDPDILYLFRLFTNCAVSVCSLGKGDVLLVGRAKGDD